MTTAEHRVDLVVAGTILDATASYSSSNRISTGSLGGADHTDVGIGADL